MKGDENDCLRNLKWFANFIDLKCVNNQSVGIIDI